MSPEEKLLRLAGFQPIVSEAQAYQITRNFNKSLAKQPYLNGFMSAHNVLNSTKNIKVGSYFIYWKMPVKCKAVSKDGVLKTKFASTLYVLKEKLSIVEMGSVCLYIMQRFNLYGAEGHNIWNLIAYKKYEELYEYLEKICETQENSTVRA